MNAFRKLKLMLALFLIGVMSIANAQTRYSEWTGQNSGEYTLSQDIRLQGTITLSGDLTIHVAPGTSPTIRRNVGVTNIFIIPGGNKLTIHGQANDTI